jgi:hypothetical protein
MSDPRGGAHLPSPSVWPFVLGAGVALAAFGVPTNLLFSLVGALLVTMALVGWIGDLRRE